MVLRLCPCWEGSSNDHGLKLLERRLFSVVKPQTLHTEVHLFPLILRDCFSITIHFFGLSSFYLFFYINFFFFKLFQAYGKVGETARSPSRPLPHPRHVPLYCRVRECGSWVTLDGPALTHPSRPRGRLCMRVPFRAVCSAASDKWVMTWSHHYSISQESFGTAGLREQAAFSDRLLPWAACRCLSAALALEPQSACLFTCRRGSRSPPRFGHEGNSCLEEQVSSSWANPRSGASGSQGKRMFGFMRNH